MQEAVAAFSDGINTGFYINSYTTKHCPTMENVLEQMRQGLERLEDQRKMEKARAEEAEGIDGQVKKRKTAFSETLATLSRLSSSYRRCYWKTYC